MKNQNHARREVSCLCPCPLFEYPPAGVHCAAQRRCALPVCMPHRTCTWHHKRRRVGQRSMSIHPAVCSMAAARPLGHDRVTALTPLWWWPRRLR